MDGLRPVLEYEVMFAPGVAIWVQGPADAVARSTLKPVSLLELSVHVRLIWLPETAVAVSEEGGEGYASAAAKRATARSAASRTYRHGRTTLMRSLPSVPQNVTRSPAGMPASPAVSGTPPYPALPS